MSFLLTLCFCVVFSSLSPCFKLLVILINYIANQKKMNIWPRLFFQERRVRFNSHLSHFISHLTDAYSMSEKFNNFYRNAICDKFRFSDNDSPVNRDLASIVISVNHRHAQYKHQRGWGGRPNLPRGRGQGQPRDLWTPRPHPAYGLRLRFEPSHPN